MPRLDGYAVARRLRGELSGRVRLIALTAYGTAADRERAFSSGFDFHVQKPADPQFLRTLLGDARTA
jgi:CheY-like chemotaxis protein